MATVKLDPAKGVQIPNMTTTERNAVSSPETGALVWNTTTSAVNQYNGSAWGTVGISEDTTKLPLAGGALTGAVTTNSTFDGVDIATRDAILTSTTTTADAALPKAGGTMTGNLAYVNMTTGDSTSTTNKIRMGASSDLVIHHDGANSYIEDTGTGKLAILGSQIEFRNPGDSEVMLTANENGSVDIYYNNDKVFETHNQRGNGVRINGYIDFQNDYGGAERGMWDNFVYQSSTSNGIGIYQNSSNIYHRYGSQSTGTSHFLEWYNPNGGCGSIYTNGSSTSYGTSSDYRLKENINYDWDATTKIKQLKPAEFNFIADADTTMEGFLAHEVSDIVPAAVTGEKDGMFEETLYTADDVETQGDNPTKGVGDIKTYSATKIKAQSIDQSKLVPLLVKTIQELEARITTLESA